MSKLIDQQVGELVSVYSKYDRLSQSYTLNISDIPDFDLHKLAALMIQNDEALAHEATGPDNPYYETIMLPALTRHLKQSTDREGMIAFNEAWTQGITNYLADEMQSLIDEKCDELLSDENVTGLFKLRNCEHEFAQRL